MVDTGEKEEEGVRGEEKRRGKAEKLTHEQDGRSRGGVGAGGRCASPLQLSCQLGVLMWGGRVADGLGCLGALQRLTVY